MLSYIDSIYADISPEFLIREWSNSWILAKIKFSRIKLKLQYYK